MLIPRFYTNSYLSDRGAHLHAWYVTCHCFLNHLLTSHALSSIWCFLYIRIYITWNRVQVSFILVPMNRCRLKALPSLNPSINIKEIRTSVLCSKLYARSTNAYQFRLWLSHAYLLHLQIFSDFCHSYISDIEHYNAYLQKHNIITTPSSLAASSCYSSRIWFSYYFY